MSSSGYGHQGDWRFRSYCFLHGHRVPFTYPEFVRKNASALLVRAKKKPGFLG
jgi:hypothetical protein